MTDNYVNFMKKVEENSEGKSELKQLMSTNKQKLINETKKILTDFAKSKGFDLSDEDFCSKDDLDTNELKAVAGGGGCGCIAAGLGFAKDDATFCLFGGASDSKLECLCVGGGFGID